jgi:hypothetical protein
MRSKGERTLVRILSEVPSTQSPGVEGVQRASHSSSHKSLEGSAFAEPFGKRMDQNSAGAI